MINVIEYDLFPVRCTCNEHPNLSHIEGDIWTCFTCRRSFEIKIPKNSIVCSKCRGSGKFWKKNNFSSDCSVCNRRGLNLVLKEKVAPKHLNIIQDDLFPISCTCGRTNKLIHMKDNTWGCNSCLKTYEIQTPPGFEVCKICSGSGRIPRPMAVEEGCGRCGCRGLISWTEKVLR